MPYPKEKLEYERLYICSEESPHLTSPLHKLKTISTFIENVNAQHCRDRYH